MVSLYRICRVRVNGNSNWNRTIKWCNSRTEAICKARNMNINKSSFDKDYMYVVKESKDE